MIFMLKTFIGKVNGLPTPLSAIKHMLWTTRVDYFLNKVYLQEPEFVNEPQNGLIKD